MSDFAIGDVDYTYLHQQPNPDAKYGLVLTYWSSNIDDLEFFLNLIDKTWLNRSMMEISVCSAFEADAERLNRIKPLVNYMVRCNQVLGHQNGTTSECNGGIYPLYHNPNLVTIMHTDADTIILHYNYFFGGANILLDSGKLMMLSSASYEFDHLQARSYPHASLGPGTSADRQFGSVFILNTRRLKETTYWPFKLMGHFEYDRYTQFIECGLSVENDVILLKRMCYTQPAHEFILYGADFHLGVMHSTNYQHADDRGVDRKTRILQIMGVDRVW